MSNIRQLIEYDHRNPKGAGSNIEEKLFLFGLLRMIKPSRVLEIGVSRGHMTAWLALALHMNGKGELVSVDNFSKAHGGQAASCEPARTRVRANGMRSPTFVTSDSVAYLTSQPDDSFDVVWVDGDHSYDGARADIVESLRVASKVVCVHDTSQLYSGPRDAIADVLRDRQEDGSGFWVKGCRGIWIRNVD